VGTPDRQADSPTPQDAEGTEAKEEGGVVDNLEASMKIAHVSVLAMGSFKAILNGRKGE
jgi:hypothetical protein